jgi:Holliday junction DNA helicase RuvA
LRGVVEERGEDWLIVAVGGFGLHVAVPGRSAGGLAEGARVALFTHLHVREDALALYGFESGAELRLFEQLIGVSGVGPRAALGLLSAVDHGALASAIAAGDASVLRRVPGIGQKTAERIVLDLRDKVTPPDVEVPIQPPASRDDELIAALMGLGYTQAEAAQAAGGSVNGDTPLEERVRTALSYFARP